MAQRLEILSEMLPAEVIPMISTIKSHEGRGKINQSGYRLSFTEVDGEGAYRIETGKKVSHDFRIADDTYTRTSDFLLAHNSANECTIVGTECLIYYLSALQNTNPVGK